MTEQKIEELEPVTPFMMRRPESKRPAMWRLTLAATCGSA